MSSCQGLLAGNGLKGKREIVMSPVMEGISIQCTALQWLEDFQRRRSQCFQIVEKVRKW